MTPAHLHLMLNHAPAFALACGMLVMLYGLIFRKNSDVIHAGLWLVVLSALAALPTFFSGEGAEDAIKGLPGVENSAVEPHEEAGSVALWSCIITGIAALFLLWRARRTELPRRLVPGILLLGIITSGILIYTGSLGGKISHPELRAGFVAPPYELEYEKD